MTVFEYALFRYAAVRMTPVERERAEGLAKRADAGDANAAARFRQLALDIIADAKNREKEQAAHG